MGAQCIVIPKPTGEVLTETIVRLGRYVEDMIDGMKVKIWRKSGMFEHTLYKVVVSVCIVGMDMTSTCTACPLPGIAERNASKFTLQHVLIGHAK